MDATTIITILTGSIAILIPVVALVFLAVVAVIVVIVLRRSGALGQLDRALSAGNQSPREVDVLRGGRTGEATVLDRNELECVAKNRTVVYHRGALVLELRPPGYPPYRVPCEQWFVSSKWSAVAQGSVVPVRIDPRDPQVVFVDPDAIDRARAAAEQAERDAHARRQAELLGANRR